MGRISIASGWPEPRYSSSLISQMCASGKNSPNPRLMKISCSSIFLKCSLHTSRALLSIPVDTRSWNTQGGEDNHFLDIQSKEDYVHTLPIHFYLTESFLPEEYP